MNRTELAKQGFAGFIPVQELSHRTSQIPITRGVYAIVRAVSSPPAFLARNPGGWFKGKDPTVDKAVLEKRWVDETQVLYFGKAERKNGGLQARIDELNRFAHGEPIGHWGGRYLWQVRGAPDFLVGWKETLRQDPLTAEWDLMHEFRDRFGSWPFANIQGPRRPSARAT